VEGAVTSFAACEPSFFFFFFFFLKSDRKLAGMVAGGRRRWRLKAAVANPNSLLNWAMNWTEMTWTINVGLDTKALNDKRSDPNGMG
jgi:hypothetical protein